MKKTIEIMAVIIGLIVVIGVVVPVFFGTFNVKAYGISVTPTVEEEQEITAFETCDWGFADDNNEFFISLPVDLISYGVGNPDIPDVFTNAFDSMKTPEDISALAEIWVSEDGKKALRLVMYTTDENDFASEYGGMEFSKQYSYNTPYIINYATVYNGLKVHLDFVLDNEDVSEGVAFEKYAQEIVSNATMVHLSDRESNEFILSDNYDSNNDSGFIKFVIFISIFGIIFSVINVKKKVERNTASGGYWEPRKYSYNSKPQKDIAMNYDHRNSEERGISYSNSKPQKDIAMDYDHCDDKQQGMSYSAPAPQEYDRDYQRYAYGVGMTKEDKLKKQDQYRSLLESGMIEKDEYNDKIAELNKLYRR